MNPVKASVAYKNHFNAQSLAVEYARTILGSGSVGKDRVTSEQFSRTLDDELSIILKKVGARTYRFTDYRQMLLLKGPKDRPREICIPTMRDKLTLASLKGVLHDSLGALAITRKPQILVEEIAELVRSGTYDSFVKLDIKRYYSSVSHEILMRIVRRRIRKPQVLHLIEAAIKTPSSPMGAPAGEERAMGLPEGLSISNALANLYLEDFDRTFGGKADCKYYRYVDDILMLCHHADAQKIEAEAERTLAKLGLKLNDKRSRGCLSDTRLEYLGYVFQGGDVSVRAASIRKLETRLERLIKRYARAVTPEERRSLRYRLSLSITGCVVTEEDGIPRKLGWVFYYSQATDIRVFAQLDRFVLKLSRRYRCDLAGKIPSFRKALYEVRYRASGTSYVTRLSYDMPVERKREVLVTLQVPRAITFSEVEVHSAFSRTLRSICREMERDVGDLS